MGERDEQGSVHSTSSRMVVTRSIRNITSRALNLKGSSVDRIAADLPSSVADSTGSVESIGSNDVSDSEKPKRKPGTSLFERNNVDTVDVDVSSKLNHQMSDAVKNLIKEALAGFNVLTSQNEEAVVNNLEREEHEAETFLIKEGDIGDKLYIIEMGSLLVTNKKGTIDRPMGPGSTIGELALLYDAPRSATVQCVSKSVVWSLKRDIFKRIQVATASEAYLKRARILLQVPEFARLSQLDLSRLIGCMKFVLYEEGEFILKEGVCTSNCLLIERGTIDLFRQNDQQSTYESTDELDRALCIVRSSSSNNGLNSSSKGAVSVSTKSIPAGAGSSSIDAALTAHEDLDSDALQGSLVSAPQLPLTILSEGAFIGLGILRGKGRITGGWEWRENEGGAVSSVTLQARGKVEVYTFSVETFENLLGSIDIAPSTFNATESDRRLFTHHKKMGVKERKKVSQIKFTLTNFTANFILGSGTFGVVTLAEFNPTETTPLLEDDEETGTQLGAAVQVALKSMNKADIVEMGQLRHVLDESRLLAIMSSRFVLHMFGTYQTPNELVMVTEVLTGGDLWSVIYETQPYQDEKGLSIPLTQFYAASIVSALAHIHDNGASTICSLRIGLL
jgi:CRP-like cAMP-binding protein